MRGLVLGVGLVASALGPAWAGSSWHAALDGHLGATDNVFAAPDEPTTVGGRGAEADGMVSLRPGVLYTRASPRVIHEVEVDVEGNAYFTHRDGWGLSSRAGWRVFGLLTKTTEADLGASASWGRLSTLTARTRTPTEAQLLPAGSVTVLTAEASEGVRHALSEALRFTHTGRVQLIDTEPRGDEAMAGPTRAFDGRGTVGLERSWQATALGLEVGSGYASFDGPSATGTRLQRQVEARAAVRLRRDLSPRWSASVDGGATVLLGYEAGGEWTPRPVVGGQLAYAPAWGWAALAARRDVRPNLYLAQNTVVTGGTASALLPLPWLSRDRRAPEVTLAGVLDYERVALLEVDSDRVAERYDLISADVSLAYRVQTGLQLGLRYQLSVQEARGGVAPFALDFTRHTVLLSFSAKVPDRQAGEVPRRTGRVDRRDVTPVAGEAGS